ncbi:hypothetical protein QDW18_gp37 [Microbacterium phage Katzastrophic]|uniref:hypothetical protein n=1 Tax=Microbacterium phage Katzastrophic TaxID=2912654 RepID=UPI00242CED80|nr:hypothetical protein QDW18_gp37 [Microbacterium phage Katzastrophic]UKH48474.1 hypothetical protein SEA_KATZASTROPHIC_37 [Microbacterium phage Katzastrophic]
MNNNDTSLLPHEVTLAIVQRADQMVDDFLADEGETLSSAGILLSVIEMVSDNAGFEIELRITKGGYQLAFPQSVTVDDVLDNIDRGFEVMHETIYNPID